MRAWALAKKMCDYINYINDNHEFTDIQCFFDYDFSYINKPFSIFATHRNNQIKMLVTDNFGIKTDLFLFLNLGSYIEYSDKSENVCLSFNTASNDAYALNFCHPKHHIRVVDGYYQYNRYDLVYETHEYWNDLFMRRTEPQLKVPMFYSVTTSLFPGIDDYVAGIAFEETDGNPFMPARQYIEIWGDEFLENVRYISEEHYYVLNGNKFDWESDRTKYEIQTTVLLLGDTWGFPNEPDEFGDDRFLVDSDTGKYSIWFSSKHYDKYIEFQENLKKR